MQNIAFLIWLVCGVISFVLTLPYLPGGFGILTWPLFPFFGIYAGFSVGEWLPSALLFGGLAVAALFVKKQ